MVNLQGFLDLKE